MTRPSHSLALNEVQKSEPKGFKGKENLTRRVLSIVPQKQIASELKVSESIVSKWINQMKPIPTDRMFQIIKAGKFYCRDVSRVEDEIDMMMILQFGEAQQ